MSLSKIIWNLGENFKLQAQIFSLKLTKVSETKAKNGESSSDVSECTDMGLPQCTSQYPAQKSKASAHRWST